MIYAQMILDEGRARIWSSLRGRLDEYQGGLPGLFEGLHPVDPRARVMIHLVGDDESVTDEERASLMEAAKRAGFLVARIETGAPMDPEIAFGMMALPFT